MFNCKHLTPNPALRPSMGSSPLTFVVRQGFQFIIGFQVFP